MNKERIQSACRIDAHHILALSHIFLKHNDKQAHEPSLNTPASNYKSTHLGPFSMAEK